MGLDVLTERLQEIRRNQPAANKAGFLLNVANMVCLDEFLKILDRTALVQFKTLLIGLIGAAGESISVLNLYIAQLETANNVALTFLNTFRAAKQAALSALPLFPFDDDAYLHCPPVQAIKEYIAKAIPRPDPSSVLPGNAGKYAKKYKQSTKAFKELEYRIFRNQRKIVKLRQKIEELQTQVLAWQAIVDAIGEQFGV